MPDPFAVAIMQKKLKSITRQMAISMIHSCRSLNLSEARDFCTGIYGVDGGIWEQSEFIPIMAYTVPSSVKYIANYFKNDLASGDVIIHNDPYTGGNQTSDVKIVAPVFYENELFCFVAVNAHQADIGGAVAGGYNPVAREIWQEALRLTPVKIYEKGELRRDVWDLIFANIRLPIVKDDVKPMIGACNLAVQEIINLIEEQGPDNFLNNLNYLFNSSELSLKEKIEMIPEGVYYSHHPVFGDGINSDKEMIIKLKLTVADGRIEFDYTGTSAQSDGYVNAPYAVTVSGSLFTLLMTLPNVFPKNQGMLRRLSFNIPEDTILNPGFPAATGFGNHLTDQIGSAVLKALYQTIPQQVTAGWNPLLCVMLSGYDNQRKRYFADMLINACKGGSGAGFNHDGWSHLGLIGGGGGITAQDPELMEMENPLIFHKFELACDSAGNGEYRGGLGVETIVEIRDNDIYANIFGDGTKSEASAFGLAAGGRGGRNSLRITLPDGEEIIPGNKEIIGPLPAGTRLHQIAGGGGGFGLSSKRSKAKIERDLKAGYISRSAAVKEYQYDLANEQREVKR